MNEPGLGIVVRIGCEAIECVQLLVKCAHGVVDVSSPYPSERKGSEDEVCHNAEIICSSFQSKPQIMLIVLCRVDNPAICEDHLKLDNAVAGETSFRSKVAEAA